MDDSIVIDRIFTRMDASDKKFDTKFDEIRDKVEQCNLDILGVQKDLTNTLNNKKDDIERSKRKMYYITGLLGVVFTAYAAVKEIL